MSIINPESIYEPIVDVIENDLQTVNQGILSIANSMAASQTDFHTSFVENQANILNMSQQLSSLHVDLSGIQLSLANAIGNMSTAPVVGAINNLGNVMAVNLQNLQSAVTQMKVQMQTANTLQATANTALVGAFQQMGAVTNLMSLTNLASSTNFASVATNLAHVSYDLSNVVARLADVFGSSNSLTLTNNLSVTNFFTNTTAGAEILTNDLRAVREGVQALVDGTTSWIASEYNSTNYWAQFEPGDKGDGSLKVWRDDVATIGGQMGVVAAVPSALAMSLPVMSDDVPIYVDFSPRGYSWWPPFAAALKGVMTWAAVGMFFWLIIGEAKSAMYAIGSFQQILFPKVQVLGNTVGVVAIFIYIGLILTLLLAPTVLLHQIMAGNVFAGVGFADFLRDPVTLVSGFSAQTAEMLALGYDVAPVQLCLQLMFFVVSMRLAFMASTQVASMTIRFLPA